MGKKVEKKIKLSEIKPEEQLKYEIAGELGLLDKVLDSGWKSLSAKETGKIGGLMNKRKRTLKDSVMAKEEDEMIIVEEWK